eukprot:281849_1
MNCLSFDMMVYSPDDDCYNSPNEVLKRERVLKVSDTEVRRRLQTGEEILRTTLIIFFTCLSGSGKSTIANALCEKLMELQSILICIGFIPCYRIAAPIASDEISIETCYLKASLEYEKAGKGIIKDMIDLDHPYEEPQN